MWCMSSNWGGKDDTARVMCTCSSGSGAQRAFHLILSRVSASGEQGGIGTIVEFAGVAQLVEAAHPGPRLVLVLNPHHD